MNQIVFSRGQIHNFTNPFSVNPDDLPKWSPRFERGSKSGTKAIETGLKYCIVGQGRLAQLLSALSQVFPNVPDATIRSAFENWQSYCRRSGSRHDFFNPIGDGSFRVGNPSLFDGLSPKAGIIYKNSSLKEIFRDVLVWRYKGQKQSDPLNLTDIEKLAQSYWTQVLGGTPRKNMYPQNISLDLLRVECGLEFTQIEDSRFVFQIPDDPHLNVDITEFEFTKDEGIFYILKCANHIKIGYTSNLGERLRKYPPNTELIGVWSASDESVSLLKKELERLYPARNFSQYIAAQMFELLIITELKTVGIIPELQKEWFCMSKLAEILNLVRSRTLLFGLF